MPVAMITGGASWFSRETAKLLLAQGWQVALSDINQKALDEVIGEIGGSNKVDGGLLNVTDLGAVKKYVADLVARKGSVDALINVAGGSNWLKLGRPAFHETKPEQWDMILKPNINGVLNCCYAVLPQMIKQKKGSIVSIASGMGLRGQKGSACYSAAKAAIIAFSQSLCQEVGQFGIRVNTIAPGSAESRWQPDVNTPQGQNFSPLGSRTSAKDVADAVTFLISERASHITGSCLDISGGTSLH